MLKFKIKKPNEITQIINYFGKLSSEKLKPTNKNYYYKKQLKAISKISLLLIYKLLKDIEILEKENMKLKSSIKENDLSIACARKIIEENQINSNKN